MWYYCADVLLSQRRDTMWQTDRILHFNLVLALFRTILDKFIELYSVYECCWGCGWFLAKMITLYLSFFRTSWRFFSTQSVRFVHFSMLWLAPLFEGPKWCYPKHFFPKNSNKIGSIKRFAGPLGDIGLLFQILELTHSSPPIIENFSETTDWNYELYPSFWW